METWERLQEGVSTSMFFQQFGKVLMLHQKPESFYFLVHQLSAQRSTDEMCSVKAEQYRVYQHGLLPP